MLYSGSNRYVHSSILWVAIIFMFTFNPTVLAAPNPFAEVPADHWSYHALERMHTLGLIDRPRESVTRLSWRLTRVEMAIEVASMVDTLVSASNDATQSLAPRIVQGSPSAMVSVYNERVPPHQRLLDSDIRLIQDLIAHFRPELEALGYRFESLPTDGFMGLDALARALGRFQIAGEDWLQQDDPVRLGSSQSNAFLNPLSRNYALRLGYLNRTSNLEASALSQGFPASVQGSQLPLIFSAEAGDITQREDRKSVV